MSPFRRFLSSWPLPWYACLSTLAAVAVSASAQSATKVACTGEQTTHSAHRVNDPEYPLLMAKLLDPGFSDTGKMALYGGGFVEGGGPLFTVGNFAHPQGTVLVHDLTNPKTYTKSDEFQQLLAFTPDIVVLGPFGWHETLAKVPLSGFPTDYDALIDALKGISSHPRVALVTPIPEAGVDKKDGFTEIEGYVKATASRRTLPLFDVWTEFLGKPQFYQDDFHLNLEGRTHLAKFIAESVKQLIDVAPGSGGAGGAGGTAGAAGAGAAGGAAAGSGTIAGQTSEGGGVSSAGSAAGGQAGASGVAAGASGMGMAAGGNTSAAAGANAGAAAGGSSDSAPSGPTSSSSPGSCTYAPSHRASLGGSGLGLALLCFLRRKPRLRVR